MYKISELASEYKKKLVTPDVAAKAVKSGDRVHLGAFGGIVNEMDRALAKRVGELQDVRTVCTIWGKGYVPEMIQADPEGKVFKWFGEHLSGLERKLHTEGHVWYVPLQFREMPKMYNKDNTPVDVMMFQAGPMDRFGNFNLGPQVAHFWGLMETAKTVIVEINENMPLCHGVQNSINLSQVTYVVQGDNQPLTPLGNKPATDIEKAIANHIVPKIQNGSTLQLGIGGIPNTIGTMLADSDIQDLSCHTEMFVDAYIELFEAGKISGNKNVLPGKMVYTFAMGSEKLHQFLDNNPMGYAAPVDFVNGIGTISSINKMVSINSCLQVDLYGQACSESVGPRQISGTGGQLDYVLGAFMSEGGMSFLCTPSTRVDKNGNLESQICPTLSPGSIVTSPRSATSHVVTEYGCVNLKGKSTFERAELLISIAHPDLRDDLMRDAEKMGLTSRTSRISI